MDAYTAQELSRQLNFSLRARGAFGLEEEEVQEVLEAHAVPNDFKGKPPIKISGEGSVYSLTGDGGETHTFQLNRVISNRAFSGQYSHALAAKLMASMGLYSSNLLIGSISVNPMVRGIMARSPYPHSLLGKLETEHDIDGVKYHVTTPILAIPGVNGLASPFALDNPVRRWEDMHRSFEKDVGMGIFVPVTKSGYEAAGQVSLSCTK